MHAFRPSFALLLGGLLVSGCLIGFDAGPLSGGGHTSPGSGPGSGNSSDAPDLSDALPDMARSTACVDFSSYTGMPLPNWVDGHGTWRVATMASGNALVQTAASMSRHETFVGWQGGRDYTDVSISAVATLGNMTDENCVLVRVQDASNYYALCVNDVGGRNGPPAQEWRLNRMLAGTETQLSSGSITITASHTFTLRVQGGTLYPSVDGDVKLATPDSSLTHGAAGVRTDDQGGFMSLCTVPL